MICCVLYQDSVDCLTPLLNAKIIGSFVEFQDEQAKFLSVLYGIE